MRIHHIKICNSNIKITWFIALCSTELDKKWWNYGMHSVNENENAVAVTKCPSALSAAANRECVLTWSFTWTISVLVRLFWRTRCPLELTCALWLSLTSLQGPSRLHNTCHTSHSTRRACNECTTSQSIQHNYHEKGCVLWFQRVKDRFVFHTHARTHARTSCLT